MGTNVESQKKEHLRKGSTHYVKISEREKFLKYEEEELKPLFVHAEKLCNNDKADRKIVNNVDTRVSMIKGQFDNCKKTKSWNNLGILRKTITEILDIISKGSLGSLQIFEC